MNTGIAIDGRIAQILARRRKQHGRERVAQRARLQLQQADACRKTRNTRPVRP